MTLATRAAFDAAAKQTVSFTKTASRSISAAWASVFDLAGSPSGTLSAGNTANGVVPTSASTGFPAISAFAVGATGYLWQVEFGNSIAATHRLFDCLFRCGAYAFNAATTLASQPSYAARVPGANYNGIQLWFEAVTTFTGTPTVTVTYTNQAGTTGRSTGAFALTSASAVGRCGQMPLQAGDTGVMAIESVTGTVAAAGTFNILVLRPLWAGRSAFAQDWAIHDMLKTGAPVIYSDSALYLLVSTDVSSNTGAPDLELVIVNG